MRTTLFLMLFIALGTSLNISCKKEDKDTNSIVGAWVILKTSVLENNSSAALVDEHDFTIDKEESTFTFRSNNTYESKFWEENNNTHTTKTGSYSVISNELILEQDGITISAEYSINNDVLKFKFIEPSESDKFVLVV